MSWKENLFWRYAREVEQPAPRNVRPMRPKSAPSSNPRHLTDDDLDSFDEAANKRELRIWQEIDWLLEEQRKYQPMRVRRMRADIAWMRDLAHELGLEWGKEKGT